MITPTGNTAEFLLSEAHGERSRALFTLPAGQGYLRPGTFLDSSGNVATSSEDVAGLLYGGVDTGSDNAGSDVKATVIDSDAEVHGELLQWAEDDTDVIKTAFASALNAIGIRVRWTVRPTGLETDQTEAEAEPPSGGGGG
ncbi:head decoration protein [Luteimonas sp. SMYT11W]|uniref:Head decoration protein n=1 Tax=Luteimonas flava TaxID=3115822 RepID=A0ABU7WD34_9GAMM